MQKIIPHLWFDKEAKEAAEFYASIFPDSKINSVKVIRDTPSGDCDIVAFELAGNKFMAINAGPLFKFNPSISFLVACKTKEEVDSLWAKLSAGGKALMPLDKYPFSAHYGWTTDRYGLSWQIMLIDEHYNFKHKITPTLLFVGEVAGKAEEAMNYYASIFPDSKVGGIARYPAGMEPEKEGTVMHGAVTLANQEFFAMDSAQKHEFQFNEAISLIVNCENQQEIDHYWSKLSAVPESEQCGWLKDRYGVSWQVTPDMNKWLASPDDEKNKRATAAMLKMKKIVIADLENA